jgi:site-specific DNA-cytosine methylase
MGLIVLSLFDGISAGRLALERAGIKVDKYYASEIDKYAVQVSRKNWPDIIQLGDITRWREWNIEKPDMVIGGSPCFVAGTKVICKNEIKSIEDIVVGDEVLTHTGNYKKVLNVGGSIKDTYEIKAQGHTPTSTTSNHPYYARKRNKVWNNQKRKYEWVFSQPEWVKVCDLTKGDYVGTPILSSNKNPYNLTPSECYLLGLYIGDGHTRKDYRNSENRPNDRYWQLIISVGSHEKEKFNEVVKLKHSFYKHTKNVYRAVFSSKRLVQIAEEHCGIGAQNKKLSKMLLDLPNNLLQKVIAGYEFADGSSRNNVFRATTISKHFVETLSLAIAKIYKTTCCIEYTKRPCTSIIEGRKVNQKDTWTISYRKEHKKQSRTWIIDNVIWNPIKSIKKTQNKELVYNIEVDVDNSYIANGHIVHNCQGFSFAGKQLNFKDPRSKLFFVMMNIIEHYKPTYRLLENVVMKKEYKDVITEYMGVESVLINSALVSAQNRKRLYWFNWEVSRPEDKGLLLKAVLEENCCGAIKTHGTYKLKNDKAQCLEANYYKGPDNHGQQTLCIEIGKAELNGHDFLKRVYSAEGKSPALTAVCGGNQERKIAVDAVHWRKLTPVEYERLQNFPDNYTEGLSNSQRYKCLGNSWTVDVIAHIFQGIKTEDAYKQHRLSGDEPQSEIYRKRYRNHGTA